MLLLLLAEMMKHTYDMVLLTIDILGYKGINAIIKYTLIQS